MKITPREIPPRTVWTLEQAGIHPLLARLYAARGVIGTDELEKGFVQLKNLQTREQREVKFKDLLHTLKELSND